MTPPHTTTEGGWEKGFDQKFIDPCQDWWQTDLDFPETITPSKVKSFISSLLAQQEERIKIDTVKKVMDIILLDMAGADISVKDKVLAPLSSPAKTKV